MPLDRRRFFELTGLTALSVAGGKVLTSEEPAVGPTPDTSAAAASETAAAPPAPKPSGPLTATRWAMVVDLNKCLDDTSCDKCTKACHAVHNVPTLESPNHEVKWIWKEPFAEALPEQHHDYMDEHKQHAGVLVFCNHCDNPPCTRVCPTQATWKREDGIVMMDWHRCIGCRYCVAACPYGSRSFNWTDPRKHLEKTDPDFPTRSKGVVEKCNFCEERLARGEGPACAEACEDKALVFGDIEDPGSEVRKLLRERPATRRKPALGTKPEIYYLV